MNLYSSEVICNSSEGSTPVDFLHTRTLNCREKSDEFRESSKRMASECDVTSERYHICLLMTDIGLKLKDCLVIWVFGLLQVIIFRWLLR